jgi:hypothetical protein
MPFGDTIIQGCDFQVNVYSNYSGGAPRSVWVSPFSFTGTGEVKNVVWGDTSLFPTAQLRSFFDIVQDTYTESWDGVLPDIFAFAGIGQNGYPDNLGRIKVFSFTLRISGPYYDRGSFCIEQGDPINNTYDWLFDDPQPTFTKTCWAVARVPCSPPIMDNCPTQIEAIAGEPVSYRFSAHDPELDEVYYYLISGPGVIEIDSGLWTYTPSLSERWTVIPIYILAGDMCFGSFACENNRCSTSVAVRGVCGDVDFSNAANALDATKMINCFYKGAAWPNPVAPFDCDGNGANNALDVTYLINYLYKGGNAPLCTQWP